MNLTLGVILGNRGFFPDHLCDAGRREILAALEQLGANAIILHVAVNTTQIAAGVREALGNYLGWDVYMHGAANG